MARCNRMAFVTGHRAKLHISSTFFSSQSYDEVGALPCIVPIQACFCANRRKKWRSTNDTLSAEVLATAAFLTIGG